MFYVTGDTHGNYDIYKLSTPSLNKNNISLTSNDYLIICGDFGLVWNNSPDENYWLDWLNEKPCITLFVDGNHENHNLLNQMKPMLWNGGFVRQIRPKVMHLMRGQIFNIDGTIFFTMGGAASIDKQFRREGVSWWAEEMPSVEEYKAANKNLEKANFKVDYILTHTAPTSIVNQLIPEIKPPDKLTNYLENIKENVDYKHWYFGHFHIDEDIYDEHTVLYNSIIKIGE